MATTYFAFQPSTRQPFQFQPTFDGVIYTVVVTWSLFGKRFYLNIFSLDGTLVACKALVGSPAGFDLQSLVWASGQVTATARAAHGIKVGKTVDLTIAGAAPDAFNGAVKALITGPTTFTYPVAAYPGVATLFGQASAGVNLVAGYFASSMIFRQGTQQFEVSP